MGSGTWRREYRESFKRFIKKNKTASLAYELESKGMYRRALTIYQQLLAVEENNYYRQFLFERIRVVAKESKIKISTEGIDLGSPIAGYFGSPFVDRRSEGSYDF